MYKAFSAQEFRDHFKLPNDYVVEGFLSYGAWDREKHVANIQKVLHDLGIECTISTREGFLSYVSELKINGKIYWFVVMYGGALLSEFVHLASLFGSKRNIHIGSCGSLNPEMGYMELLLPTWAYGNESTTRVYEQDAKDFRHYPDEQLLKRVEEKIPEKYRKWKGPIITNQAMMGETWDDVKSWSEQGYFGVEMEVATIFAVSKHFDVPSAALLYGSDNLIKGQTVGDESHTKQKEERERVKEDVYRIGVLALLD